MTDHTAYRTDDSAALDAWTTYLTKTEAIQTARQVMFAKFGRALMVNRSGFGHGTRVVGFERLDSDKDGDTPLDGLLRVKKHERTVVPNIRRKAGKDLAVELSSLSSPELSLPGMPAWHLVDSDRGISTMAPALWLHDGAIYALWATDSAPVEANWQQIPLSAYYAAKERLESEDEK